MKIEKTLMHRPFATIQLWIIPTVFYLAQKLAGLKHNELEWIWWVLIPFQFLVWFLINWKIKK